MNYARENEFEIYIFSFGGNYSDTIVGKYKGQMLDFSFSVDA